MTKYHLRMISSQAVEENQSLQLLSKGNLMKKLTSKKKINERFILFNFKKNKLVIESKEVLKNEKTISFFQLDSVKKGLNAEDTRNVTTEENLEDRGLVIFHDGDKSLSLLASDLVEQQRWITVIDYLIKKKNSDEANTNIQQPRIMAGAFELADKDGSSKLAKKEIESLLKKLNYDPKNIKLKSLIKQADIDKDGKLDKNELVSFLELLYARKDIQKIFNNVKNNKDDEHMSLEAFQNFLQIYQNEPKTLDECTNIINDYECQEEIKEQNKITLYGFINYMIDKDQHLYNPKHDQVYQDMNLPVCNYFINSSHNTYLSGDQVTSKSSASCYRSAILKGARLVELDIYDGPNDQPIIYHGSTMTTKILFEDVLLVCKENAFVLSDYPLILTLELHCKEQLNIVAELIFKHLSEFLYTDEISEEEYPSPEKFKNRIIIRAKKAGVEEEEETLDDDDELKNKPPGFNDLVKVMQNAKFENIDHSFEYYQKYQTSSLSEVNSKKLLESETPQRLINYTNNFITKIYPAYYRQDSSNLNALDYWIHGFQIVALNFQTKDTSTDLNSALFNDNGNSGFVLKPDVFRDPEFDPTDITTMKNKKKLQIEIISGQKFCQKGDTADPFVQVEIYGIPSDNEQKEKTSAIKNNGFNPEWNEEMNFFVNCPELAFVKFKVVDKDIGKDDLIGQFIIRFESLRTGYRHFELQNKKCKGSLFVHIKIEPLE